MPELRNSGYRQDVVGRFTNSIGERPGQRAMKHLHLIATAASAAALACGDSTGPDTNPVSSIEIVTSSTRLLEGGVLQLRAVPRDANGAELVAVSVQWRSANEAVATVTPAGEVRGVRPGSTDVIAYVAKREQAVTVHVVARPTSCSAEGTIAEAAVADSIVWRTADGPHHLTRPVSITGTLILEPGALICGGANGSLEIGTLGVLRAAGAPGDTIVFTASNPQVRWGGISALYGMEIDIRYARIEHARNGVQGVSARTVVEDSRIAAIEGVGISVGRMGAVRRTVVSNARWGIRVDHGSGAEIRGVVIRQPTETGVTVWRSQIALHDVRVEDSGGVGISFAGVSGVGLTAASNIVVTRSAKAGITTSSLQFTLTSCTVSDGGAEGVVVSDAIAVTIRGCNFVRNAGPGVLNGSFSTVDATMNWWGDPAGPNGPNGDGVSGDVTAIPALTGPADMTNS